MISDWFKALLNLLKPGAGASNLWNVAQIGVPHQTLRTKFVTPTVSGPTRSCGYVHAFVNRSNIPIQILREGHPQGVWVNGQEETWLPAASAGQPIYANAVSTARQETVLKNWSVQYDAQVNPSGVSVQPIPRVSWGLWWSHMSLPDQQGCVSDCHKTNESICPG
jgi:hypothetical protein